MKSETPNIPPKIGRLRPCKIGAAIVDPKRMTVSVDDQTHQLTDLTWRFLEALVDAAPGIAKYQDLAGYVWRQEHVSDETMAQRVRQLRQVFGDTPKVPTYIRTARGVGYQLIAEITDTAEPVVPRNRKTIYGALAVVAVAALIWIGSTLNAPPSESISARGSVSELVSRADDYRGRGQVDANETAIGLYEKALGVDAENQRALIGLSFSLAHKSSKFGQSVEWAGLAAKIADRAILNDPSSAGAFAARGMADDARGHVSSAIDYYQKSLQFDPSDQSIRSSAAYLLQIQGRYHDALSLEAQALDAAAPTYYADYQIAIAFNLIGLPDAAKPWVDRATVLRPDNVFLADYKARELIKAGDNDQALGILSENESPRAESLFLKSIALSKIGSDDKALKAVQASYELAKTKDRDCYECLADFARRGMSKYSEETAQLLSGIADAINDGDEWPNYRVEIAYLQLATGDPDAAIHALQQAYTLGYRDWRWLQTTPLLAGLQNTTAFKELTDQMQAALESEKAKVTSDPDLANLL